MFNSILDAIGNTPLVKLQRITTPDMADIYVKCEFMNPSGSIKDRMAKHIVEQAEKRGDLKPGGTIIENTSGNTGMALAMISAAKGYRCIFTMPDKMSTEKVNMMKSFGAEVIITPTDVPGDSPEHYVETAKRIARETPGAFYVNQYHTPDNIQAHYESTGKEIFAQTNGEIDAFVAGTGTGGTLSGVGRYFKERAPQVKMIGVDPVGSVHYDLFHHKKLITPKVYKVEGVGEDIECGAMDFSVVDDMLQTNDMQAFTTARRLIREEGLFCGGSSGALVYGAMQVAKKLGPGKKVVTLCCDSASRYISKFLSDSWMIDYGFMPRHAPELGTVKDLLEFKPKSCITASIDDTVSTVIDCLKTHGISQVPIVDKSLKPQAMLHEVDIYHRLQSGDVTLASKVMDIAHPIKGMVSQDTPLSELNPIFEQEQVAVVMDDNRCHGIIAQIDMIEYMMSKL